MATTGNIENQGVNVPGLSNARRLQETDDENRVSQERQADEARVADSQQEDLVSVNPRVNPGDVEQQEIRAEDEFVEVPSQDVQGNLQQTPIEPQNRSISVDDLNSGIEEFAGISETPDPSVQVDPNPSGSGASSELAGLNQSIRDDAQSQADAGDQGGEELRADGGSALDIAGAPADDPTAQFDPVQGQEAGGLTSDQAGQANANNEILRDAAEQEQNERAERENQETAEAEGGQAQRGQNVDQLI